MTRADKRWQLLLVANDGRIIPFRHIKGIALMLVLVLLVLALLCLVLGWQLTTEKLRYRQTTTELNAARQDADRYKRELELLSADLVLNEARMEKAGLPVPDRTPLPVPEERAPETAPDETENDRTVSDEPDADTIMDDVSADSGKTDTPAADNAAVAAAASDASVAAPKPEPVSEPLPEPVSEPASEAATVAIKSPSIRHDAKRGKLFARFRIENTGDRSKPVAGRCVVVLTDAPDGAPDFSMPEVPLEGGEPDGQAGQAFNIRRYMTMEISRQAPVDPSVYRAAVIHVFDDGGAPLLENRVPLDLPPPPQPAVSPETPASVVPVDAEGRSAPSPVSASDLKASVAADRGITIRLRVKNVKPGPGAVRGRLVIVLKGDGVGPDQWLSLPDVPMVDGTPEGTQGRSFRIVRFIDLTLQAKGPADPSIFDKALVLLFDEGGQRLFSREFPVAFPAPPSAASSPPATPTRSAATSDDAADVAAPNNASEGPSDEQAPASPPGTPGQADTRARF